MLLRLFQIGLIISILIFLYALFIYFNGQERKLKQAQKSKTYFYLDNPSNIGTNLRITYQGYLFIGEKQLGISTKSFDVITIYLCVQNSTNLNGITINDLLFLEQKILKHYPAAKVKWLSPLSRIL